jgi:hypothetical protein
MYLKEKSLPSFTVAHPERMSAEGGVDGHEAKVTFCNFVLVLVLVLVLVAALSSCR